MVRAPVVATSLFANQGIKTLNELAGRVNSDFHSKRKPTRVQRRVLSHITECCRDAYHHVDPHEMVSLSSLCSSSKTYDSGRSDVEPYVKENISWPEVSNCPVALDNCLPPADREWLGAWRKHMLHDGSSSQVEDTPVKPYVDPILKQNVGTTQEQKHDQVQSCQW